MKSNTARTRLLYHSLVTSLLILGAVSPLAVSAAKGNPVVEVAGMNFNVNHAMVDNLKAHQGKKLTLHLSSGSQITGKVIAVGQHMVHVEKIAKREFMDALIRIETIDAIEGRFRAYQRDLGRLGLEEK